MNGLFNADEFVDNLKLTYKGSLSRKELSKISKYCNYNVSKVEEEIQIVLSQKSGNFKQYNGYDSRFQGQNYYSNDWTNKKLGNVKSSNRESQGYYESFESYYKNTKRSSKLSHKKRGEYPKYKEIPNTLTRIVEVTEVTSKELRIPKNEIQYDLEATDLAKIESKGSIELKEQKNAHNDHHEGDLASLRNYFDRFKKIKNCSQTTQAPENNCTVNNILAQCNFSLSIDSNSVLKENEKCTSQEGAHHVNTLNVGLPNMNPAFPIPNMPIQMVNFCFPMQVPCVPMMLTPFGILLPFSSLAQCTNKQSPNDPAN